MDELTVELAQLARNECEKIIEKISQIKMIDKNELHDHFLPTQIYFNEIMNNTILKKKKKANKRNLPKNEQCLGRKGDFTQCTRKRKDGTHFCGSHMKKLTNGMIGDDGACFNRKKGKRGRKRKNIMENVGENDILTTKVYIEGERYLVDNKNVVYTFNQNNPVILGYLKDGSITEFE